MRNISIALISLMANYNSAGFTEVRISVVMLWVSIAFGLAAVAARSLAFQSLDGSNGDSVGVSLLVTGLLFIFIQARLIMRLSSGNGSVRVRILVLAVLRIIIYLPVFPQMMAVSAYLILPAVIAAILQFGALLLVFTPPGSHWFAASSGQRA